MDEPTPTNAWFTRDELPGMLDFWRIYEAHYEDVTRAMQGVVAKNPKLGEALQGISGVRERTRQLVLEGIAATGPPTRSCSGGQPQSTRASG